VAGCPASPARAALLAPAGYLLADVAMRSTMCTSVQPVCLRIAPDSVRRRGRGAACLGCSVIVCV
jgi:hypothetical protein